MEWTSTHRSVWTDLSFPRDHVIPAYKALGRPPKGKREVGPDGGIAALGVEIPAGTSGAPHRGRQLGLDVTGPASSYVEFWFNECVGRESGANGTCGVVQLAFLHEHDGRVTKGGI